MVARLGLSSHTVTIERNKGGKWSLLGAGGSVAPEEPIRYSAHFGLQWSAASADFRVEDSAGRVVWGPQEFNANPVGNAWVDATAPIEPGVYTLIGTGIESMPGSFGLRKTKHDLERTFRVSSTAPPPPGGGQFPDVGLPGVGSLFGSPWAIVIILGALLALGILI